MKRGLCFNEFTESKITFRPTYKFNVNSDEYDSGPKKRLPSWTDRILYIQNPSFLECKSYFCDNTLKISDHKPVYATFNVHVDLFAKINDESHELTGVPQEDLLKYKSESQVCTIM